MKEEDHRPSLPQEGCNIRTGVYGVPLRVVNVVIWDIDWHLNPGRPRPVSSVVPALPIVRRIHAADYNMHTEFRVLIVLLDKQPINLHVRNTGDIVNVRLQALSSTCQTDVLLLQRGFQIQEERSLVVSQAGYNPVLGIEIHLSVCLPDTVALHPTPSCAIDEIILRLSDFGLETEQAPLHV